jgi:hypothetical protein
MESPGQLHLLRMKLLIRLSIALTLGIFLVTSCNQKPIPAYSLLMWENVADSEHSDYSHPALIRYRITDSGYAREQLYLDKHNSIPGHGTGVHSIYKNRYYITDLGHVFDLVEKKFIFEKNNQDFFIEQVNDSVIFSHNLYGNMYMSPEDSLASSKIKSQYYFFDIASRKIVEINSGERYRFDKIESNNAFSPVYPAERGLLAPDKIRLLYFIAGPKAVSTLRAGSDTMIACAWSKSSPVSGQLWLQKSATDSVKLLDSVCLGSIVGNLSLIALWINNDEVLTECDWGKLALINVSTGKVSFITVPGKSYGCPTYNGYLTKMSTGEIFYNCFTTEHQLFNIDLNTQKAVPVSELPVTRNLSFRPQPFPHSGLGYYYLNGQKLWDDSNGSMFNCVSDRYIAIPYWRMDTSIATRLTFDSLHIFTTEGNKKVSVKLNYTVQPVGWIKE